MLCTCSGNSGRGTRIHIHVIYSVTYNFSIVASVWRRAKQLHYNQRYTTLTHQKFSAKQAMTNGNASYHTDLPQSYKHVFLLANVQTGSYLYFLETHIRSTQPLEGAGGRRRTNDRRTSIVGQKICGRCSGKYTLCGHGFTDITRQFPISQDFWEIKRMRKQWIPGSLSPAH